LAIVALLFGIRAIQIMRGTLVSGAGGPEGRRAGDGGGEQCHKIPQRKREASQGIT